MVSSVKFIVHNKIKINGKDRLIYCKSTSKSNNPILYIKYKGDYITYNSYLKLNKNKKMRGGIYDEKDYDGQINNAANHIIRNNNFSEAYSSGLKDNMTIDNVRNDFIKILSNFNIPYTLDNNTINTNNNTATIEIKNEPSYRFIINVKPT